MGQFCVVLVFNGLPADELRKSIELAVPDVVTLLSDSDSNVRSSSATALPILASHGELKQ